MVCDGSKEVHLISAMGESLFYGPVKDAVVFVVCKTEGLICQLIEVIFFFVEGVELFDQVFTDILGDSRP